MASRWVKTALVTLTAAAVATVTACSSSGAPNSAGKTVTLDFWGSAIGYDKSVARWNQTHSDIKINYAQIAAGSAGGYAKMQNAVKAGNAPCLGQVGYDTLPDFVVTGAAQDISQYANADKSQFTPWTWQMTGFGGKVFGIPVDAGPEALFYRADLFEQYGITPPKTWSEFAADAEKVHAANPAAYLTTTPQDAYDLGALTWQAGGKWFGTGDNQWQVTIDSPTTRQVADYWQGLLGKHLATSESTLDTAWFKDVQNGKVLSLVSAVWAAPLIAQGLPGLSGKWAVAPMPQWTPGQAATGSRGGSATVVLTGCKYPQQATEFADWLSTNSDSVTNLIKNTGIYPAATSGQDLPAVNQPSAYFGGQNIYQVFKTAAANISPSWGWGPTMVQVQSEMKHGLKLAGTGQGTIPQAVTAVQADTVTAMKSQGLSVSGG